MNKTGLTISISNQLLAALATLKRCSIACPSPEWNQSHGDAPFSQVLFHVLFYADYYLSENEGGFRNQAFHLENRGMFRDYEELENRIPVQLYSQTEIARYLDFCRQKTIERLHSETTETLMAPSGFPMRKFNRFELYLYLTRHIQHHAAQLALRLQAITGQEMSWISSGWQD